MEFVSGNKACEALRKSGSNERKQILCAGLCRFNIKTTRKCRKSNENEMVFARREKISRKPFDR